MIKCYCNSGKDFTQCCKPYIDGVVKPPSAEALMRSRYSAYATRNAGYIYNTTAPKERRYHSEAAILQWAASNHWLKLEVLKVTATTVEFKAYYLDPNLRAQVHYELSRFTELDGTWFYVDGTY